MAESRVQAIQRLPVNVGQFIAEIAAGMTALYGPKAGEAYLASATHQLTISLNHPDVMAFSFGAPAPAGLMTVVVRENVAHVLLLHVLGRHTDGITESMLIEHAVNELRRRPVVGIVCETVPMCSLDLDAPFARLGFTRIERMLMHAPLTTGPLAHTGLLQSEAWQPEHREHAAEVIVNAYQEHPGRQLHTEVRTVTGAAGFLRTVADGSFGATRAAFCRTLKRGGEHVGVIVGCEAAPDLAFVLQVAVRADYQNQGIGTALLRDLAQCFRDAGYTRIALGVTRDNPASNLYARLGFKELRAVNAYVWWREGVIQP